MGDDNGFRCYSSKEDAKKIYAIAVEMKEAVTSGSGSQTPLQNLKCIKGMLDEGLITQAEYEAKKADILSRMYPHKIRLLQGKFLN
jgi:hypothetical protein